MTLFEETKYLSEAGLVKLWRFASSKDAEPPVPEDQNTCWLGENVSPLKSGSKRVLAGKSRHQPIEVETGCANGRANSWRMVARQRVRVLIFFRLGPSARVAIECKCSLSCRTRVFRHTSVNLFLGAPATSGQNEVRLNS